MSIYLELFFTFFIIGLFSFGGGMGMMPMIEQEVVQKHAWLTSGELYQFIGIAESTPGPIAINVATFIGNSKAGFLGALCSTVGVVLPSFFIILIIASFFKRFSKNPYVKAVIQGIKPVVLGLLFAMCIKIISTNILSTFSLNEPIAFTWQALLITGLLLGFYFLYLKLTKKKLQPIAVICLGAIMGILIYAI